jgi:hypothetical protein
MMLKGILPCRKIAGSHEYSPKDNATGQVYQQHDGGVIQNLQNNDRK